MLHCFVSSEFSTNFDDKCHFSVDSAQQSSPGPGPLAPFCVYLTCAAASYRDRRNNAGTFGWSMHFSREGKLSAHAGRTKDAEWLMVEATVTVAGPTPGGEGGRQQPCLPAVPGNLRHSNTEPLIHALLHPTY